MRVIDAGNLISLTVPFTDENGAPIDPVAVQFNVVTGGVRTVYSYSGATVPAPEVVARDSIGMYTFWYDTTAVSGTLSIQATGEGLGQATSPPEYFYVNGNIAA